MFFSLLCLFPSRGVLAWTMDICRYLCACGVCVCVDTEITHAQDLSPHTNVLFSSRMRRGGKSECITVAIASFMLLLPSSMFEGARWWGDQGYWWALCMYTVY